MARHGWARVGTGGHGVASSGEASCGAGVGVRRRAPAAPRQGLRADWNPVMVTGARAPHPSPRAPHPAPRRPTRTFACQAEFAMNVAHEIRGVSNHRLKA